MAQMYVFVEPRATVLHLLQVVEEHQVAGLHQPLTRGPTKGQQVGLHRPTIHTRLAVERGRIAEHRVKA